MSQCLPNAHTKGIKIVFYLFSSLFAHQIVRMKAHVYQKKGDLARRISHLPIELVLVLFLVLTFLPFGNLNAQFRDLFEHYANLKVETLQDLKKFQNYYNRAIFSPDLTPEEKITLLKNAKNHAIKLNDFPSIISTSISEALFFSRLGVGRYEIIKELSILEAKYKDRMTWEAQVELYRIYGYIYGFSYHENQQEKRMAMQYAKKSLDLYEKNGKYNISVILNYIASMIPISYDSTIHYIDHYCDLVKPDHQSLLVRQRSMLERHYGNTEMEIQFMLLYYEQMADKKKHNDMDHQLAVSYRNHGMYEKADSLFQLVRDTNYYRTLSGTVIPDINIGKMHMFKGDWALAEKYLLNAHKHLLKNHSSYHTDEVFDNLQKLYVRSGQTEKLLACHQTYQDILIERAQQSAVASTQMDEFKKFVEEIGNKVALEKERRETMQIRYIMAGFILLVLTIGLLYFFKKRAQLKYERLNQQLGVLQLKALQNQFKSHFTFNLIFSIQYLIKKGKYEEAFKGLGDFALVLRAFIDNVRQNVIPFGKELQLLQTYLDLEKMRFGNRFDYVVELPDNQLPLEIFLIPTSILQPLLENALKHAFIGLQRKGIIKIRAEFLAERLRVLIEDNGVGFDTVRLPEGQSGSQSVGLKITKERMEVFSQMTHKPFGFRVMSSFSDPGFSGTKVVLDFPKLTDQEIKMLSPKTAPVPKASQRNQSVAPRPL